MLNWLSLKVPALAIRNRVGVLLSLTGAIVAHLVEIWLFAIAYFLAGIESLLGLVLITWTASFLFIEMQKFWGKDISGI